MKKNTVIKNSNENKTEEKIDKLEKMVITALEDNKRTIDTLLPNIGNTYNTTNKMTINVFLNEQCKDAINMNTFVNNLKLSFEDLQYTTNHGYVKGISNIFLKNLHNLNQQKGQYTVQTEKECVILKMKMNGKSDRFKCSFR